MKRHVLVTLAAALALGFTATIASADCDFEHPKKAKKFQSNLVQAFISCGNVGGNTPNDTAGGVPSCKPPQSFCEASGNCPGTGWEWSDISSQGQVQFKAGKNKVVGVLNPPGSGDLAVKLKLKGIENLGGPASGPGTLETVARATLNDRGADAQEGGGDDESMTVVDFAAPFTFNLENGKVTLVTSATVLLNFIGVPALPGCSNIEVVSVRVIDSNGDPFANIGTFIPDQPGFEG